MAIDQSGRAPEHQVDPFIGLEASDVAESNGPRSGRVDVARRTIEAGGHDPDVAWVSGTGGTFGVTVNGGKSWRLAVVPGADSL